MNQTPNCPCRWCEKRSITCHSSCPDYKEWKKIATMNGVLERKARKEWRKNV